MVRKSSARNSGKGPGKARTKGVHAFFDRMAFGWKTRAALYRHLSTQFANDIAAIPALEMFQARLQRRGKRDSAKVVGDMVRRMKDGKNLSEAMGVWIPQDEIMIIASGEMSGAPAQSFDLILEAKGRVAKVKRALTSSLVTPAIYLVALFGMLWGIGAFVVPGLQQALPTSRAHGLIGALYVASAFATSWWAILPLVLVTILAVLVVWSLPQWTGRWRVVAERTFPWSFYRDIQGYTWLLGFSALLRAGMADVEILKRQAKQADPWLRERLVMMRRQMENGASLPAALYGVKFGGRPAGFPNPDMIDDIASMAGFKDFAERIAKVAVQWADELEWRTMARAKTFGFAVEMAMYGAMGFLMVAINSLSTQMGSVPGVGG
jgi:type II secretory pathway component PulF